MWPLTWLLALTLTVPSARADEPAPAQEELRYLVGLRMSQGPEYPGSRRRDGQLSPMWALHWGRWRITTAGTGAMMGFGSDRAGPGPGATRDWLHGESWRIGLGLRIDGGRHSEQAEITKGLPDVPRTLRGRLYAQVELDKQWTLSAACSPDILNRRGGTELSVDFSRRLWRSPQAQLSLGVGVSAADGRHAQSYFGVPVGSEAADRLGRAYVPGSGLEQGYINLSYLRTLGPRWVLAASWSEGRLLDVAAASPLAQTRRVSSVSVGLAYRR